MKVYMFETGHYRGLWGGPLGLVVARDEKSAREQLKKLCSSDDSVRQLTLVDTTKCGVHKITPMRCKQS